MIELAEEYRRRSLEEGGGDYAIAAALLEVAEQQGRVATALKYLGTGDAASTMGAIEFLAVAVREGSKAIASAQTDGAERLADAIDGIPPR